MDLIPATQDHIAEMMSWFPDRKSSLDWGGPQFRFPFSETSFRAETRVDELPSYSLVGDDGKLLGFGQYAPRAGRCHLARLAVAPDHRGRGLGTHLIRALCRRGCHELGVDGCSLFALAKNAPAIRLYNRLGFALQTYPEGPHPFDGCIYMTAALATVVDAGADFSRPAG